MQDWAKTFRNPHTAIQVDINLRNALAHCWPLEAGGWSLRCVKCEVGTGTSPTGFGYGWHSHNEYQIEIAAAGAFEFLTPESEMIVIRRGEAIVIPWKVAHRWKCLRPGIMVGISLELLPTAESIYSDGWLLEKICKVTAAPIKPMADDLIQSALDAVHPSFRSKITASRLFLLLVKVMEELMPSKQKVEKVTSKIAGEERGRELVAWVVRHLKEHLGAEISLSQIAREIHLSTRQVHRLFLKHVGKSLHDYLLETRLEQARKLLTERGNKMQVKEIAFTCGFNSLAHFSNCFRQAYGVAPSTIFLKEISLKSGFTWKAHDSPGEAPGPVSKKK